MSDEKIRKRLARRFGEALRQARGRMTREELAARSGVSVPSIARYELGHRPPGFTEATKLAETLPQLSLDDIARG